MAQPDSPPHKENVFTVGENEAPTQSKAGARDGGGGVGAESEHGSHRHKRFQLL